MITKDDAIGSVHFAINNLVSTLEGIHTQEEIGHDSLEVELGEHRVFLLQGGVVVCQPYNFPNVYGVIPGERVLGIKVLPYEPETGAGSGSSAPQGDHPTTSPAAGGDKKCPTCDGTGRVK